MKIDRRIRKTREAIEQAMIRLLQQKSLDTITIREITEEADIHRGTFYLHYLDKYDVIEQWETSIFEEIEAIAAVEQLPKQMSEAITTATPAHFIVDVLHIFNNRRNIVQLLLSDESGRSFENQLRDLLERLFTQNASRLFDLQQLKIPLRYLLTYITSAHIGVIRVWMQENEEDAMSPEQMATMLFDIAVEGPLYASNIAEQLTKGVN